MQPFSRTGRNSHYRGELCDLACAQANNIDRQGASYHNRFFYNTVGSNYAGTGTLPPWSLSPDGLTNTANHPTPSPQVTSGSVPATTVDRPTQSRP
jgi:hypothetical protein